MWIKREIHNYIASLVEQRPALVLTGARQTGKTSLLKNMFPHYNFVSLDYPREAAMADQQAELFLDKNAAPIILDEVQYAPGIFRSLKAAIDKQRNKYGQYLMTGSQNFLMMKNVSESLAGRVSIVELEGLSYFEINEALGEDFSIEDVLLRGGFPELYENPKLDAQDFLRSYLISYLERDLRNILNVSNVRDFDRFIRACALRSSQLLNQSELAKDVGISPTTAAEWLSVLQASGQLVLLEPWYSNKSKSLIKSPKLYMADVGMLCFLLDIQTKEDLLRSPYLGPIWETFVFAELRKRQMAQKGSWRLYFIRDRAKEVDFLIHKGGVFELIEAKWTSSPDRRDCQQLKHFTEFLGPDHVSERSIVCPIKESFLLSNGVTVKGVLEF